MFIYSVVNQVKVQLKDIKLSQLNTECLRLVASYLRVLRQHNGTVLRMQDADILLKISDYSHRTRNQELKNLYVRLKQEMRQALLESQEPFSR